MYQTGFDKTNLQGKCHQCKHYEPLIKDYHRLGFKNVEFCRGHCLIHFCKDGGYMYKQRTETCKKFVKGE